MKNKNEILPFTVFISSSQKEFEELRNNLKEAIDGEELFRISGLRLMKTVLIEQKRGDIVSKDIKRLKIARFMWGFSVEHFLSGLLQNIVGHARWACLCLFTTLKSGSPGDHLD